MQAQAVGGVAQSAVYHTSALIEQFNAFAPFGPEDLSFTHLDEEKQCERQLHFAGGTNCPLRFLGGGQKVPGQFTVLTGPSPSACANLR